MLHQTFQELPEPHRSALPWFMANEGKEVAWRPVLPDGTRVFSTPKGIYKPDGTEYALTVRQTLGGSYPDREPIYRPDGTWSYAYHQEGDSPSARDDHFTNRGLMACREDGVPIGVARQTKSKPGARYRILGVARVTDWRDGFFHLEGYASNGLIHLEPADGNSSHELRAIGDSLEGQGAFDPASVEDGRERALASIIRRRGQGTFRASLLRVYGGRCALTGCPVEAALEAAHVTPYLGPATNTLQNGLLLRADLHTLWDLGLWAIDEESGAVILGPQLVGTDYDAIAELPARLPANPKHRPTREALMAHRKAAGL